MILGGNPAAIVLPFNQCVVPQGVNGPVVIFITSDGQPLVNNVVDRATNTLVAGPTMVFIDTSSDLLDQLARPDASDSSDSSSVSSPVSDPSVSTIPATAASSIIQSISATTATATATATTSATLAISSPTATVSPPAGDTTTGPIDSGTVTVNGWTTVNSPPPPSS
jgi:hypothetical protein